MQTLADQLRDEIQSAASGSCLLWVDPAQSDPFEGSFADRRVPVPINHWRFAQRRAPYLVPLDLTKAVDLSLFDDSVARACQAWTVTSLYAEQGQAICGWVLTNSSAEAVANHWGWRCHLHGHAGRSRLLRFHDPGVREWLWPALSELQQRALLGPASCMFGIGRRQSLLRHACPPGELTSDYFRLDDRQWRQVGDYATVHAAWLSCVRGPDAERWTAQFSEQVVLAALAHAQQFGVTQESERTRYALHAVQFGGAFYLDARMRAVWELTRDGAYYGNAVEEIFECTANELHMLWTTPQEKTTWPT